jgi:hypothetical protein
MGGFAAAWAAGEAIVVWRQVRSSGRMPVPGALIGVSALFLGLAVIADISPKARPVVTLVAWGLDVAGILNIWPAGLSGEVTQAEKASAAAGNEENT